MRNVPIRLEFGHVIPVDGVVLEDCAAIWVWSLAGGGGGGLSRVGFEVL